jgi:hypothetical protein
MRVFRTTGIAAGLIASGTLIGASLSTLASVYDWSTTPATNATADPNINWAEGMLPSQVNDSARATMAAVAAWRQDTAAVPVLGGAGNAFSITGTQPMQAWTPGLFAFKATRSNTGAVTVSRDSLTAKPLRAISGVDLISGQIILGAIYLATYAPATDEVLLIGKVAVIATDFAPVSALTVKANITGSPATPADVSLASFFGAAPANSIPATATNGYSGQVIWMNSGSCPTGWIAADGTSGSPDLRGAFVRGLDNGRGLDPSRSLASFQNDALGSHSHTINDPGHSHTIPESGPAAASGAFLSVPLTGGSVTVASSVSATGITVNAAGGAETRPKNVALLACYHT